MTPVPLHPALVHLPLGLAFVLPVLSLGFSWALWKGHVRPRAWLAIVLLQGVLLGGGLLAMKTGQGEEKRVESIVPEPALERHEELAEQFLWATGITLLPAALVLILHRPGAVRALTGMTVVGTMLVAVAECVLATRAVNSFMSTMRRQPMHRATMPKPTRTRILGCLRKGLQLGTTTKSGDRRSRRRR